MNKKLLKIYQKAQSISNEEKQKKFILDEIEKIEEELTDNDWEELDKIVEKDFQQWKKEIEDELKKQNK